MRPTLALALASFAAAASAQAPDGGARPGGAVRHAADGGRRALGGGSSPSDGGPPQPQPQGAADAGAPAGPYQPRAAFVLARDTATLDKWGRVRPSARAALPALKSVRTGERVVLGLFLDGFLPPASGTVDLSADVVITDCRGRTVEELAMFATAKSFDQNLETAAALKPAVPLQLGLTDPDCAYTVKATIFDYARGSTHVAKGTFEHTR